MGLERVAMVLQEVHSVFETDVLRNLIEWARLSAKKPIVLADVQDNPGAGGTSDTVGLLAATLGRLYASTYYALHDTRTPLRFALLRVGLSLLLGYVFAVTLPPFRRTFS